MSTGGIATDAKKKKKREPWIFGSVSGTFPMTSQQPWSPLDRDRKGKPIVPTLRDECRVRAICTCCIFRHTTNIRNERGSFRDSLVSGDLNGYRYLCEFTHSAALRPIEGGSFWKDSLGFSFFGDWNYICNIVISLVCFVENRFRILLMIIRRPRKLINTDSFNFFIFHQVLLYYKQVASQLNVS